MPRVPTYEPNRVAPASTTGARFQAARDPGSIGDGLANFGKSLNDFAVMQDKIDEQFDDTVSRKLTLEYQTRAAQIRSQFEQQEGLNAVGARTQTDAELAKIRDEIFGKATTPRMKLMLEERVSGYYAADSIKVGEHATRQLKAERKKTLGDQRIMAAEMAVANWDSPDLLEQHKATGLAALDDLAAEEGWNEATIKLERDKFSSGIHKAVIDNFMVADDIDAAEAYLEANSGELMHSDELRIRSDLMKPLQNRQAFIDYQEALGMTAAPSPEAVGTGVKPATTDIKAAIRGPESGGNDNAKNALGSSASGRYQFIEGTFKGLWKEVYGGDADNAWATKRFDPAVQERLMDRLIVKNSAVLRDNGQAVDNGNLYIMHVLGAGDGPKLLKADPNEKVSGYLSSKIVSQNPTYFGGGKTVGEALAVIRSKVGGGAPTTPPRADKTAIYENIDRIASRDGWSYERTERAKTAADRETQRADSMAERTEAIADREASDFVLGKGAAFTDVSQIPASIRDRMSPQDIARYQGVAERNAAPKEVAPNGVRQRELNLLRVSQEKDEEGKTGEERFAELPLAQYMGEMSRAEFDTLVMKQAEIRNKKPAAFNIRGGISSAISWAEKMGSNKLEGDDFVAVVDMMDSYLTESYKSNKNAPSEDDYMAAYRKATREFKTIQRGTFYDGEGVLPRYKLQADNIPPRVRDKVVEYAKILSGNDTPTEAQIVKAFRMGNDKNMW